MGRLFERIILESRWKRKEFQKSSSSSQPRWEGGTRIGVYSFLLLTSVSQIFFFEKVSLGHRERYSKAVVEHRRLERNSTFTSKECSSQKFYFFFYLKTVEGETGTAPDDPGIGKNKKKKSLKFKFEKVFFQQRPLVAKTHWVRFILYSEVTSSVAKSFPC